MRHNPKITKKSKPKRFALLIICLSLGSKGCTVGALALGGVALVGNDLNFVKRTVVFVCAVVLALSNSAADSLVCGIALSASAGIGSIHFGVSFHNRS